MRVSAKQDSIAQAIADGKTEILLEGAIGTSKTYGMALVFIGIALDYPGSVIPIGRRHLPELRKSTLLSFREAASDMGLVPGVHYTENKTELYWRFDSGSGKPASYIYFVELDHVKDPQFLKVKGINATCAGIDEADGVSEGAFITLNARTGRANKNGAPAFTMLACNANDSWPKRRLYDKYRKPEEFGELEPQQCVIEFNLEDSFLGMDYYRRFENNPPQWVERYLRNNWDYGDDEHSLFKYRYLDALHVVTYTHGHKTIGYDVARSGKDRSVCCLWDNGVLVDIVIVKDFDQQMDGGEQARWLHDYAVKNGVGYEDIIVDGVGLGVTVIDNLKTIYGWEVTPFIAGAKPEARVRQEQRKKQFSQTEVEPLQYNNLRSEQTYLLAAGTEKEPAPIHFYDSCPYLADFKKEATMHKFGTSNDRQLIVESKDKVKERTGHSPDVFDSVMMGYYKHKNIEPVGSYGARGTTRQEAASRLSVKRRPKTAGLLGKKF